MTRAILLAVAFALSCGGSQLEVEHTVPMKLLDAVPPAERGPVADAFAELWLAEREVDRWQHVRSDDSTDAR